MLINKIDLSKINVQRKICDIDGKQNLTATHLKTNTKDSFNKSSVSFGSGSNLDDIVQIITETTIDALSTSIVAKVIEHTKDELAFETVFDILASKKLRTNLAINKNDSIDILYRFFPGRIDKDNLFKSNGIKKIAHLSNFLKCFNAKPQTKKVFSGQNIEAVKIYGQLNSKSDLSKYPDLLLYLFNQEEDKENPDFNKLNIYIEFLKQIGISDFSDFDEKCAHLKSQFNDFENISDKADAIDYLYQTYEKKQLMLSDILSQNTKTKNLKPEHVYERNNAIIDYLFEQNNGLNLGDLSEYIDVAVENDKFNTKSLGKISEYWDNLKQPEDKIDFYKFLKDCNIQVNDFNSLALKSIISDTDVLNNFINFSFMPNYISDYKHTDIEEGKEFYKNFKELINAIYEIENDNFDDVETLINVIERFNIKNSKAFLNFYNEASRTKVKSLSSQQFKEFIELFSYSSSDDLLKEAKNQNKSVVDLLTEEKNNFLEVKNNIETFVRTDETGYFAGKSSFEIYKEYKDLLLENPQEVFSCLKSIIDFSLKNSVEYTEKLEEIDKFSKFFNGRKQLLNFIAEQEIKFNNSQFIEQQYRQNCFDVLNLVNDTENPQKSQERIDYYTKNEFLLKSKPGLDRFLNAFEDNNTKKKILNIIADRKIKSVADIDKFFKIYQGKNGGVSNLINWFELLPNNIDFENGLKILSSIQTKLDNLNIPLKINNDNVLFIEPEYFIESKQVSDIAVNKLIAGMNNAPETGNFIRFLQSAFTDEPYTFTSFKIAQEIVKNMEKTDESYQNIIKKFNIDKQSLNICDEVPDYIYIKAIEEVLPKEFIDLVNSKDWINYSEDKEKLPNISLHARLRILDRYALAQGNDIYSEETKEEMRRLLKTIYTTAPNSIKGVKDSKRIIINSLYNDSIIETIFSNKGELITVFTKK